MQYRISVRFALLLVLLTASAAEGQQLFSDFPVNGQISAFQVNAGYTVSNSFTLSASRTVGQIVFGAWVATGDSVTGVAWSIGTAPFGATLGSGFASTTSVYDSSNADGFDVATVSFLIPGVTLPAGTYYLTLSSAVSAAAKSVSWDINDAAGIDAWTSAYGHVSASNTCFQVIGISGTCASSFQILSASTTVTASPSSATFPNQALGTTSAAQSVIIANNGASAATISGIAVTGADPGDFAQTNNCPLSPATLAASGTCTISVTFTPQAASMRTAAITITGSSPLAVGLSGTGTEVPSTVTLSPSSVSFPNQTVNTTSGAQTITITNSGPSPLTIGSIAVTGTNFGDFAQTNNCPLSPATIAVNSFCTINVTFTPSGASLRSASISITDNGSGSPQSVNLSGTGFIPAAWPNGYTYEATFTVAAGQVPSALTNFPALISGTFADFATTANGGRISNTCTQTVGNNLTAVPCDLIFTSDAAGTMLLNWEFETWTPATGAVNLWVNAPNFANGTVIYAWYGQPSVNTLQTTPSATWSSNFMAVYHLKENPAGTAPQMNDSTANANHATMNGTVLASQQQPGQIDGSINFEGDTWASLANPANFSFERTNSFSLSGWFRPTSNSLGTPLSKFANGGAGWAMFQEPGSSSPYFSFGLYGASESTSAYASAPSVTTGAWHYVVVTYSGTGTVAGMNIYVDGVNQPLTTGSNNLATSILNTATPVINGRNGPNEMSSDYMDEIRVSTQGVVFTPAFVTASFNNQSKPGTFFTATTGLTNSGVPAPSTVTLAPLSISFPNQTVSTTSAAQAITVTNSGPSPLTISAIGITGTNQGDFAQTNNCPVSPATIAVSSFCTINVTFTPSAASLRSAAISITDNGSGSPQSVSVSGTGTPVPPTVTPSPLSVSFPNQTVNTTSAAQSITVTNSGPNPLTISAIAITGTSPGDFAQTNNCPVSPATIAVSSFCTINVTFTPSAASLRSAAISITDNGSSSPQAVGVSGTGTPVPPTVTLAPLSVSFPNQTVNTTSAAQSIMVTNSGPNPLTISAIGITGTNLGDFAQTNNCPVSPATIAVSAFCTINVTFTPSAASLRSAAISITDNGSGSPQSMGVSGTGTPVPPTVTLAPLSVSFPNQTVNTTSAGQAITVTNSGPNPLTISAIAITGTNYGDFAQTNNCPLSPATIAASGFCTINVTFTPSAASLRSAAISITDNGSGSPQSVGVSGTGVVASPPTWPNGYTYQATFTVAAGQVPSALTNFPALISGTFADFATTVNGGRISNTCTQTVGNSAIPVPCDLIFTSDAAGAQLLSWEFETWTPATGATNVWVNAPNLANGTVIYAWYGQPSVATLQTTPSATWNSNFMAVYHLKENPAGTAPQLNDSTSNDNNATMNGTVQASQQQPGEIDGSVNFEGTTWASIANPANFSFERTDSFSLSGWFNMPTNTSGTLLSKLQGPAPTPGWALVQATTGSTKPQVALLLYGGTGNLAYGVAPAISSDGTWHHVVVTYSGTSTVAGMSIYIDGVSQTLTAQDNTLTTSILNAAPPAINGRGGANEMSPDSMDEIRISTKGVVWSVAWVTASYNNQSKPGTFFSVVTGLTN